jgi:hypothetical protein
MLSLEVQMEDVTREPPRDANGLLKRPCIEEFMSAGCKAEQYDGYFGEEWGPGWSNPGWTAQGTKDDEELDDAIRQLGLPDVFVVHSQVRRVATRTVRAVQPTRHRFKQYLLGDPHKRLTRRRPVVITARDLLRNVDTFIADEAAGKLSVHTKDGRRLDLVRLKEGLPLLSASPPIPALYNPRLDSIQHDKPAGIPLPVYVDGTFPGDPAAQRALERITAEKKAEAIRHGATEPDPVEEPSEPNVAEASEAAAAESAGDVADDNAEQVQDDSQEIEASNLEVESNEDAMLKLAADDTQPPPSSPHVDPAARRATSGKKRRR